MPITHVRKTLSLNDAGGSTVYSVIAGDSFGVEFGQLHSVVGRLSASTYSAFTAGEIRACRFPNPIVTAKDHIGRPTAAIDAFAAPDEDVFYKSGAFGGSVLAAMVASATTQFYLETIPVEDRRGCKGPWCISFRGNSGAGGTATMILDFEFDQSNH